MASEIKVPNLSPPPNATPTPIPSANECSVITPTMRSACNAVCSLKLLDAGRVACLEPPSAQHDEEQPQQHAQNGPRHTVGEPLVDKVKSRRQHQPGGERAAETEQAFRKGSDKEERQHPQTGRERRQERVEKDAQGFGAAIHPKNATTPASGNNPRGARD